MANYRRAAEFPKCKKCGRPGVVRHHVTYKPERTAQICVRCHGEITKVNAAAAVVLRSKLNNSLRTLLWNWFLIYQDIINENVVAQALGKKVEFTPKQILFIQGAYTSVTRRRKTKKKKK
jgi:hypothetical protein